jgi:ankyrin repeat protein
LLPFFSQFIFIFSDGATSLHTALEYGDIVAIEALVKAKADLNVRNVNKQAPIHLAFQRGNTPAFLLLIEFNADVNLVDSDGASILWKAIKQEKKVKTKSPLQRAIDSKATECIAALEDAGALYSLSPVHDAAAKGKSSVIESLVSERADINGDDE